MCDWQESLVERFQVAQAPRVQGAPLMPYLLLAMPRVEHCPAVTCCPEMLGMKLFSQTSPAAAGSALCCQNLGAPQFAKL